jgi:hypothetical protein
MLRAMLSKELRETLWIAGLALVVYMYYVTEQMGLRMLPWSYNLGQGIPFVGSGFLASFTTICVLFAVVLGFRQTLGESARGTWLFLLHRPAQRCSLLGLKMAVGLGLYFLCAAVPILVFAWWAATPGTHASPFEWSMTLPAWRVWLSLAAVYLGAFLSGIRPARWFGSRLLPLVAAGLLVGSIQMAPWWWLLGLACVAVLDAWLIASIFYTARARDF